MELTPNITTILQRPIYLRHIDADGKATVMSGTPTVVHNPNIGVTVVIPADAVKDENGMPYTGEPMRSLLRLFRKHRFPLL